LNTQGAQDIWHGLRLKGNTNTTETTASARHNKTRPAPHCTAVMQSSRLGIGLEDYITAIQWVVWANSQFATVFFLFFVFFAKATDRTVRQIWTNED